MVVVYKYKPETGFDTPERCHIIEMMNTDQDVECSVAQATIKPGVTTQLHALENVSERYVIVEGNGLVEIGGGEPMPVNRMDIVYIPAGVMQRITNTGDSDLIILCVCTPRFENSCYVAME